jgi:hypothetical protein
MLTLGFDKVLSTSLCCDFRPSESEFGQKLFLRVSSNFLQVTSGTVPRRDR